MNRKRYVESQFEPVLMKLSDLETKREEYWMGTISVQVDGVKTKHLSVNHDQASRIRDILAE
jgi:hypothetical protein